MANLPKIALGAWAWGNGGKLGGLYPYLKWRKKMANKTLVAVFSASEVTKRVGEESGIFPLSGFFGIACKVREKG